MSRLFVHGINKITIDGSGTEQWVTFESRAALADR